MYKHLNSYYLIFALSITLSSCLSTANFETGRTVGKGNYKNDIALSHIDYSPSGIDINFPEDYFNINLGGVYGLSKRIDIGGNVSTSGEIGIKTKFMLTKPKSLFAASIGSSFYFYMAMFDPHYLHTNLAVYTSLHPIKEITIYAYPQLLFFPKNSELEIGRSITTGIMYNYINSTTSQKRFSLAIEYCNVTYNKVYNQNTWSIGLILYQ